ncbi:MAG: hypothetical protein ACREFJ_20920 [Acetobacteraceae bacterium]
MNLSLHALRALAVLLCAPVMLAAPTASAAQSPLSVTHSAGIPQPARSADIVGLVLQNLGQAPTKALPLTFGEVFKPGTVLPSARLNLDVGKFVPVQMDAKTFNSDGSVSIATLTVMAPPLPRRTATGAMLERAPAGASVPAVNLLTALGDYSLIVELTLKGPDGSATKVRVDGRAALEAAIRNGTAKYWRRGFNVTEARVSVPVRGSLRLVFSISAYANGSFTTDVRFNNDIAMQSVGGTVVYDESIIQDGHVVSRHDNVTQYQYQDWHQIVSTSGPPAPVNVQHDIAYLEETGAVPNFDLNLGVAVSLLHQEAVTMAKRGWGEPLSPNGIDQFMPGTGGRPDIGPTTAWNAAWLMTQNATAAKFALGQADAAGAVPWHFYYPRTGDYLTTSAIPNIWTYPGNPWGTTKLTQAVSGHSGWVTDQAHQPDLSYIPYLLTGDEYYLDQLNAQATWSEINQWPAAGSRNNDEGLVVQGEQVRGAAWSLRAIIEAAFANPPDSLMHRYFQRMEDNNFKWLLAHLPEWTAEQGAPHGYLPGVYGNNGAMGPWEQDYLASTIVFAARLHNAGAKTFLEWESNFLVGRFLNGANGFSPHNGIAYNLYVYDPIVRQDYRTWGGIQAATAAAGNSNGNGWKHSNGDYGQLALQTLAGIITVTASPKAIQAYRWLLGSGAPFISPVYLSQSPQFAIVPRLSGAAHSAAR